MLPMTTALAIILTIAVFAAIIVFHEFGHFIAAKLAGMPVYEFALGFGRPILLSFKWHGTQYSLRPIPIGGYVRIAGMEPDEDVPNGFDKKPVVSRLVVIASGAGMNFVLAIIIFWIMGMVFGKVVGQTSAVSRIADNSPAAHAGIQPGDVLISAAPLPLSKTIPMVTTVAAPPRKMTLEALRDVISHRPNQPIELVIQRGKSYLALRIVPRPEKQQEMETIPGTESRGRHPLLNRVSRAFQRVFKLQVPAGKSRIVTRTVGLIGVVFAEVNKRPRFLESIADGFREVYYTTATLVGALLLAIFGKVPAAVGGPVQIGEIMTESFRIGWRQFLFWSALISVNVGVINLLPIPALDGSRLVFITIGGIRRRPIDPRKEAIVHLVGFALLLLLLVLVTCRDVAQLVTNHFG
jgi:regulator of sigma E protease